MQDSLIEVARKWSIIIKMRVDNVKRKQKSRNILQNSKDTTHTRALETNKTKKKKDFQFKNEIGATLKIEINYKVRLCFLKPSI